MPRAVVIGSGPNGLVGALMLARAGYEVEVYEAQAQAGGGTCSAELTLPGFLHDVCSAIHPLALASPAFRELGLAIDWVHSPAAVAHPFDGAPAAVLERDPGTTASGLGEDGPAYRRLVGPLCEAWPEIEPVVLGPYPPPVTAAVTLARRLGARGAAQGLRAGLADACALAEREFGTPRARGLFAGCAAHSMLPLERRPSAGFGLALTVLGHVVGWPFPRGGSQKIADFLVQALTKLGGRIHLDAPVDEVPQADVVLADVAPRELVRLARGRLPARYERALRRYRHGPGAFKLDWALAGPIPWHDEACRRAATVHLGGSIEEISASEGDAWSRSAADRPFVLLAQPSLWDASRAPAGKHTAWAYCHVPNGSRENLTARIEAQVERFAPGFRDLVLARSARGPTELEASNRNLVGGDPNGGAMDLGQLLFRPARRLVPYRTPLRGLYLCSSATPPGGGVHGMCGYSAALTAIRDARR